MRIVDVVAAIFLMPVCVAVLLAHRVIFGREAHLRLHGFYDEARALSQREGER